MINLNKVILTSYEKHYELFSKLILLNDWSLIKVIGVDAKKYLQSQLTSDMTTLTLEKHIFTAHCDANGKMWSTLRLFHYKKGFGYILRTSVAKKQLNELKKYSIFSQVTITQEYNVVLLGVVGKKSINILRNFFSLLPDNNKTVIHLEETVLLYFNLPIERFLIITSKKISIKLMKYFLIYGNSYEWLNLDIAAGFANIDFENIKKFIPQAANLQLLPLSISFNKGCYIGQEIITKTKYYNSNKRAMFYLFGLAYKLPKIGDPIEFKIGNNWKPIGTILASTSLDKGFITLQVIMKNNISIESIFRLINENSSKFTIQKLPYLIL